MLYAPGHLRPLLIEGAIADAVKSGGQSLSDLISMAPRIQFSSVAKHQVKRVVVLTVRGQKLIKLTGIFILFTLVTAAQKITDQGAAAEGIGAMTRRVTKIGDRGKSTQAINPEPGAAGFEVPACENVRLIRPVMHWFTGSCVVFVTIGGNHQGIVAVLIESDKQNTHRQIINGQIKVNSLFLLCDRPPMEIGKLNHLEIIKEVDFGLYLDGGDGGEILLPKRYMPDSYELGDDLEVFIYRDSEDRLIATTETPGVMVGECAFLKVQAVNRIGAFLDWGLPKDLLVPFNQQAETMVEGKSYVVYAYVDDKTERIAASSKLSRFLNEDGSRFKVGEKVDLLIVSRSELGFKAVINGTHLGLIFHREITRPVAVGQQVSGYIKQVRNEDARIDLALDAGRALTRGDLQEKILTFLKENEGVSTVTDRSPPELILEQFGASKGNYKKALGALYKLKKIEIERDKITLIAKGSSRKSVKNKKSVEKISARKKTKQEAEATGPWAKKVSKKATDSKNSVDNPWADKAAAKNASAEKTSVDKAAVENASADKTTVKKDATENASIDKATVKKDAAENAAADKASAKKATPDKALAKKTTAKKTAEKPNPWKKA